MSKKTLNVFEQMTEALNNATTELATTNEYLFGIGAELEMMNGTLKDLNANISKLLDKITTVITNAETLKANLTEQAAKTKTATTTELTFPKTAKGA